MILCFLKILHYFVSGAFDNIEKLFSSTAYSERLPGKEGGCAACDL